MAVGACHIASHRIAEAGRQTGRQAGRQGRVGVVDALTHFHRPGVSDEDAVRELPLEKRKGREAQLAGVCHQGPVAVW